MKNPTSLLALTIPTRTLTTSAAKAESENKRPTNARINASARLNAIFHLQSAGLERWRNSRLCCERTERREQRAQVIGLRSYHQHVACLAQLIETVLANCGAACRRIDHHARNQNSHDVAHMPDDGGLSRIVAAAEHNENHVGTVERVGLLIDAIGDRAQHGC